MKTMVVKSYEQMRLERAALNLIKWLENDEQFLCSIADDVAAKGLSSIQIQDELIEDLRTALHLEQYS